ncbi:MAG: PhoU domain-containing protein [Thermodesulfobacteriota bacterium]
MLTAVTENLRFMVNEVIAQVEQAFKFFAEPTRAMMDKINSRDDYIDNQKSMIEEETYVLLQSGGKLTRTQANLLRSINTIASNLERIADFAVNMLRQAGHLSNPGFIGNFEYESFFEEVLVGLKRIVPALDRKDINLAFRICQCEFKLDEVYGARFKRILSNLCAGGEQGNLVTCLLIFHYLERMGDSLLNIGEAIIFGLVGEKMKIQQYRALSESLTASGLNTAISEMEFESIWGTRSGCRIGVVGEKAQPDSARPVLFKHGNLKKLKKERENIERWEQLVPGLPPQVRGFVPGEEDDGAILLEYLPGRTFQDIVLTAEAALMMKSLALIERTMGQVWLATMKPEPVRADFVEQVRSRMEAVYRLHPDFNKKPRWIGDLKLNSFAELLEALEEVERQLEAPFSVFIHGDFNINNLIYDPDMEQLHFVDLHRSAQTDYIQDVSVFLTSLYRLPFFESEIRHRLNFAIMDFFEFAKDFAASREDRTFEARLALGLGRSFFSSTRFELNRKFAKKMHLLSLYLLEKLVAYQGRPWPDFELPGEILIY